MVQGQQDGNLSKCDPIKQTIWQPRVECGMVHMTLLSKDTTCKSLTDSSLAN